MRRGRDIDLAPDEYRVVSPPHPLPVRITIWLIWVAAIGFCIFMAWVAWADWPRLVRDVQHGRLWTAIGVPVAIVVLRSLWRLIRGTPSSH
jgi:hypothetical protein